MVSPPPFAMMLLLLLSCPSAQVPPLRAAALRIMALRPLAAPLSPA